MHVRSKLVCSAAAALAFAALSAAPAAAQAWTYPSFQLPRTTPREFNFAVADGAGTSLLFQWREGMGMTSANQLSLDVGYVDSEVPGADGAFLVGGQFAHQILRSGTDTPLDLLLTAGVNGAFEFTPNMAVRLSASLGGSDFFGDDDSFGVSFAWSPGYQVRRR